MLTVLDVDEAVARVLELINSPLATEKSCLEASRDRVLGEDVFSAEDVPLFNRATMDGYAVKAEDTFGATDSFPALLSLGGEVIMGNLPPGSLKREEAMAIPTGGMLPGGADSVVMLEYTELTSPSEVAVYRAVAPGENVIHRGEDYRCGEKILSRGHLLRPPDLGVLAGLGVTEVEVYGRPVVAIISTGDELVPPGETPGPGQIRDINSTALAAMVRKQGGTPRHLGIVSDTEEILNEVLCSAVESSDLVVISGGSSVGARDNTVRVIEGSRGGKIHFHGIAVRPGKPTILGESGGKPVFGLSGNPVSAMIGFLLLVQPAIRVCQGLLPFERFPPGLEATLKQNLPSTSGRDDYYRVLLTREGEKWYAEPVFGQAGLISTMGQADGLLRIPRNVEGFNRGEQVRVSLL